MDQLAAIADIERLCDLVRAANRNYENDHLNSMAECLAQAVDITNKLKNA